MVVVTLLVLCASTGAQPRYEILNLDAFGAPANETSGARSINNLGEVVGGYWTPGQTELRIFKYSPSTGTRDVNAIGSFNNGSAINDSGQIAAWGSVTWGSGTHAYRYTPGIGALPLTGLSDVRSETSGINSLGQVTGTAELANGRETAFRYTDGVGMQDLGSLFGGGSQGHAVNDRGWVTGQSDGWNIFLYRDGVGMTRVGDGIGWAINNQGSIAGETALTGAGGQAFIYMDGQMQLLGDLGGPTWAQGMNDLNQVVGSAHIGNVVHAFVWDQQTGMVNLNSAIPADSGWSLAYALDINEAGQIVGVGDYNGKTSPFLLNPIPEPSTWALMVLGGGAFLYVHRRRVRVERTRHE